MHDSVEHLYRVMQGLAANLTGTANIITQLQDFTPYLSALDPAADSYAALPNPKSSVLTDAETSISQLVGEITSVRHVSRLLCSACVSPCAALPSPKCSVLTDDESSIPELAESEIRAWNEP